MVPNFDKFLAFWGFSKKFFLNQYLNKIFPHFCGAHCFDLHKFSNDTCSPQCVLICHKFSSSNSLLLNSHCDFSGNNSLLTKICCNYFNYLQFTSGKYMHLQFITKYTCQNAIFMAYMIVPVPTPVSLRPCIICGLGNCLCLLLSDQAVTNRPFAHLLYIYSTLMVIRSKVSNYMRTRIELLYYQGLHQVGKFKSSKSERLPASLTSISWFIKKPWITSSVANLPYYKTTSHQIQKKLAKHGIAVCCPPYEDQGWTLQWTAYCQLIKDNNKLILYAGRDWFLNNYQNKWAADAIDMFFLGTNLHSLYLYYFQLKC